MAAEELTINIVTKKLQEKISSVTCSMKVLKRATEEAKECMLDLRKEIDDFDDSIKGDELEVNKVYSPHNNTDLISLLKAGTKSEES